MTHDDQWAQIRHILFGGLPPSAFDVTVTVTNGCIQRGYHWYDRATWTCMDCGRVNG